MNTLQKDILTETYTDSERLIADVVWRFVKRYGGDFDELFAEANLLFIEAMQQYNENKTRVSTWLNFSIWHGLLNHRRAEYRRQHIALEELQDEPRAKNEYNWAELFEQIKDDSHTLLKLLFQTPEEIVEQIRDGLVAPSHLKVGVKKYLKEKMGWSGKQIRAAFADITQAIYN